MSDDKTTGRSIWYQINYKMTELLPGISEFAKMACRNGLEKFDPEACKATLDAPEAEFITRLKAGKNPYKNPLSRD